MTNKEIDMVFRSYDLHKEAQYSGSKKQSLPKGQNPYSMNLHQGQNQFAQQQPPLPQQYIQQQHQPGVNPPGSQFAMLNPQQNPYTQMLSQSRMPYGQMPMQNPMAADAATRTAPMNMPSATMSNPLGYFFNR